MVPSAGTGRMIADGLAVWRLLAMTLPFASSMNMSKSFWGGDHVPSINISLVAATLLALTVSVKSLQVLGTVQIGAPNTEPLVFVMSVSVYVMVGLAGLSVPLAAGDGASGAVGDVVTGVFFPVAVVTVVSLAGKVAFGVELFEREVARFVRANDSPRNKPLVARSATRARPRNFEMLTWDLIGGLSSFY